MMKYILPALAVAGTAAAQCSVSATTTIQNAGDASALAACTTFTGSIAIATGTTDQIQLNNIRTITGDLVATNVSQMTTLKADSLQRIEGTFRLQDVQILSDLTMPRLSTVNTIIWTGLPNLGGLNFATAVQQASKVDIENTFLSSLDGINLRSVDDFYVANNNYLQQVTLQLSNISTRLTLQANGNRLAASFPNLEWAFNMSLTNVANLSIPSLAATNGSLGIFQSSLESLVAPNLTSVGGALAIVDNQQLRDLELPQLTSINGAFQVANNTKLGEINVPKLSTIGGALDFNGNFTNVSMPALSNVRGAFNMQSTGDISEICSHFKPLSGQNNVIKGKFVCAGSLAKAGGAGTTPSATASGSKSSSTGAAGHVAISSGAVLGVSGVLAAMFGLL